MAWAPIITAVLMASLCFPLLGHGKLQPRWERLVAGQQQIHLSLPPSGLSLPAWIVRHAGPSAPFHQIGFYEPPPEGCKIVQVNQVQRHGSRYPTAKVNRKIRHALGKLRNASHLDESLDFLNNYQYHLGQDSLLPLGATESFEAGVQFASRYHHIFGPKNLPFIRASASRRVVDSAQNFTAGLSSRVGMDLNSFKPDLVISEDPNVTLDNNSCPNRKLSDKKARWLKIFGARITGRLNTLATDANLDDKDTVALMQAGPVPLISANKNPCTLSFHILFCSFASLNHWPMRSSAGFASCYYCDLNKYYNHGLGNRLGQAEGIGYVAELIARLTGDRKWVEQDQSKVNQTLDQSPATFPLNQSSYVDFSHDNQMISILAALGFPARQTLPERGPPPSPKKWDVSQWMPFASRLTTEKIVCDSHHHHHQDEFVRFVLNDMVMAVPSCKSGPQNATLEKSAKICSLSEFVESRRGVLGRSKSLHEQVEYSYLAF
ncbi:hypothetical protein VP01_2197g2 [Puccinia sorghi]|uniref:Phytase A n=1 Tax=Puccinia sorghi TaxID=27349 RepID=A0A0L6V8Y6_9BASI|nr:hypothetical protein VP01_2197g2 [Puccinia sorghi]